MLAPVGKRIATGVVKNYKFAERARETAFAGGLGWTASGIVNIALAKVSQPLLGTAGFGCSLYEAINSFKRAIEFKKVAKTLEPEYQKIVDRAKQIYKK